MASDDPIFTYAEYLHPIPTFFKRKIPKGPPIPTAVRLRVKRPWENWLYGVVRNTNLQGVGTVKVYRDGKLIATAGVSDYTEADRIFLDTIEAAKEATAEFEASLT